MDLGLRGKRVLVMGASTGIGRAIAASYVQEGAKVAICARSEKRLVETAREIGAPLAIACDLQMPGAVRGLIRRVSQEWNGVDVLICNTGGPPKGKFDEITTEQWQSGFQGLWLSAVDAIQEALPSMIRQKWGRIQFITSAAAKEPMPGLTVSNGLRAGLLGLAKSLSQEVASYNITVNALLPGYTRTERLLELGIAEDKIVSQIPARRLAEPEEFAALSVFLGSEKAAYINGQAIACDGAYLKGL